MKTANLQGFKYVARGRKAPKSREKSKGTWNLPSRCSSTLSGAFMSLGSFLSEEEKGNGDTEMKLPFTFLKVCREKPIWAFVRKQECSSCHVCRLTVA